MGFHPWMQKLLTAVSQLEGVFEDSLRTPCMEISSVQPKEGAFIRQEGFFLLSLLVNPWPNKCRLLKSPSCRYFGEEKKITANLNLA